MHFTKMHALGNDFVVIDARQHSLQDASELARRMCRRRFSVGADQMLVLESSETADFKMLIYNADGSEVEMCGNGIRALAKYIWDRMLSPKETLEVETLAGIIRPRREGALVKVDMGEPVLNGALIPTKVETDRVIDYPLDIKDRQFLVTCVSMGNPHAVIFVENVLDFPIIRYGPSLENHPMFPKRTNVEFIQVINRAELRMRVWERGAGETLACGTGACASMVAACMKGLVDRKVIVHLKGGDLQIEWAEADNRVFMTGPAEESYEGEIKIQGGGY